MNCPVCDQPLQEIDPACPQCGFTLAQADDVFGQPPLIVAPITDPDHHLGATAKRRLSTAILNFGKRFPQLAITLVILEKPPAFPAKPYLFWLFNRSTTHTAMDKGGNNRQLLLWMDPTARTASLTIGYGLEPLIVPETDLSPCLQAGMASLAAGQIGPAAVAIITQLSEQLDALASRLSTAFGWAADDHWQSMDDDQAVLTLHPGSDHLLIY